MATDMFSTQSVTATIGPTSADEDTRRRVGLVVSGLAIQAGMDPASSETVAVVSDMLQSLGVKDRS